jgi:hypothetical protein
MSQTMTDQATKGKIVGFSTYDVLRQGMLASLNDENETKQYLDNVVKLVQAGAIKPIQIGNTVFLLHHFNSQLQPLPPGTAEVHVFTTESLSNLIKRMQVMPKTASQIGYKQLTTYTTDPAIAKILDRLQKSMGIQGSVKQAIENINGEMRPVYRGEMTL